MLRRLFATILSVTVLFSVTNAQVGQGAIKGKVIDKATGEPLPFANVVAFKDGSQVTGATTDFDGNYVLKPLSPGKYEIQATYVGYQSVSIDGVVVNADKNTNLTIKMAQGVSLQAFEKVEYEVPLISKDQTSSGGTVTREDIAKMPGRSAASIAQTVGGVYSKDDGSTDLNVRGGRSDQTTVFIDGVKVRGTQNLPQAALEQVSVFTGGLPAQYGDATGGVISITTRGVSKEFYGGLEFLTSGAKFGNKVIGLDSYGFNLLQFNVSGPLLSKKDSAGNIEKALLGFFLAVSVQSELDPRPSYIGDYRVKEEKLAEINAHPVRLKGGLAGGVVNSAEYLRLSDLEKIKYRQNVGRKSVNLVGKIDVATTENTTLTFGGSFDYRNSNAYIRDNSVGGRLAAFSLLNSQNNPQVMDYTWRAYGRFTQRFNNVEEGEDEENAALIKNAFVSFQVDYTKYHQTIQDDSHKDRLSRYGYVGKFESTFERTTQFWGTDQNGNPQQGENYIINNSGDTVYGVGYYMNGYNQTSYTFTPDSTINPILTNYTAEYYTFYDDPAGHYERPTDVQAGGGLLNGQTPLDVYSMWTAQGVQYNNYSLTDNQQFRVTASGNADINNHAITLGFEYEQRFDRTYSINPTSLWTIARNLTNSHIQQLDHSKYTMVYDGTYPTYYFDRLYDDTAQTTFDRNLRENLGLPVDGTDWIDLDALGPDAFKVDYFSPDELINNNLITYAGYDYTGKKIKGNPSLNDFLTQKDDNGDFTRLIPAFQPIYMAAFIQDKFDFEDLVFNIGLRLDRFDANQPVLKDKYLLFPARTVGEVGLSDRPSNIGNDYIVYVSDVTNPSTDNVVGYRSGDTWYNADGQEVNDPSTLSATGGSPSPWLVEPGNKKAFDDLTVDAFEDYTPQINLMPRIAFSFPISDEALFFAHYDVLTQRPTSNIRIEPLDYLTIQNNSNYINNPNLKPQKTIDYELGFQQKLNNYSSFKMSAFVREMRNMIQVTRVNGAYPETYFSYGNYDFGTVKGLTFTYDLRRFKNIWMRASYTLQFADGTGSSTTSSLNLVSAGQSNLRTIFPMSFDQRHTIVGTIDYHYGEGKNYNGPVLFGKKIFENAGANFVLNIGSGTPYTKRGVIVGQALFNSQSTPISGQLNGSRLPWTARLDARIDKDFNIKWGKGADEDKKEATLNVYLQVLNVLNSKNIIGVYSTTGNPDDDGYLADARYQTIIAQQTNEQSFRDLYRVKLLDPFNYSLPRRMRLGILLNF
jgi:hypothetical protein